MWCTARTAGDAMGARVVVKRSQLMSAAIGAIGVLASVPTAAGVGQEEAARLGRDLTPMGAERAGNADGSIPEWTGGITHPPPGYRVGDYHPDPFADDPVLFTITAENSEKHRTFLSPGQLALFAAYPETFRMPIYPTRRSAAYPPWVYERVRENARNARLTESGNGVIGATVGSPFPIPRNGIEALWNHRRRYVGEWAIRSTIQVMPTRSGKYTPIIAREYFYKFYGQPKLSADALYDNNQLEYIKQVIVSPGALSGTAILVRDPVDSDRSLRSAWFYKKGERRVRRAPYLAYDNPGNATDGLRTADDFDMFNGAPDRFEWTLRGKRELYIPYNSYRVHSDALTTREIVQAHHLNPDHLRYEKHRVWVVEGDLKEDASHIYAKRVFYLDEDSWQISVAEMYGHDGKIWRVAMEHGLSFYEVPAYAWTVHVIHDLKLGRYFATGLANELGGVMRFDVELSPGDFTPQSLREIGR